MCYLIVTKSFFHQQRTVQNRHSYFLNVRYRVILRRPVREGKKERIIVYLSFTSMPLMDSDKMAQNFYI